jgi:hypothetical protein
VQDGTLELVAPHGVFSVRGMDPEIEDVVARMPDGAELECEGDYEGSGNIESLIVTAIVREVSPLVPLTEGVSDDVVRENAELARARAAERLGAGDVAGAAADLASAMDGHTPGIADVYAALPERERAALLDRYAAWVRGLKAFGWDEVRCLPLDRFGGEQLAVMVAAALERGGRYGTHPVEDLVAEIDRRGGPVAALAKRVAKLRRAQATEGGVTIEIRPPMQARVVGATRDTVYVFGWLPIGPAPIVPPDAQRQLVHATAPTVIAYDTEGVERARYAGFIADLVVGDIALQASLSGRTRAQPALRRLDGSVVAQFTGHIYHHDSELVAGPAADADEVRTFSGELVASWRSRSTERVRWDDTTIYVDADEQRTYPRPSPHRGERWVCEYRGNQRIKIGPSKRECVQIELAFNATTTLMPPWLAIQRDDRIIMVALAELMTCDRIRVQGKQIAKRV